MNPLGDRARAEELARLLEGAVAGPGAQTAGFASLATRLRVVAAHLDDAHAPRAEFRAALRQRLVAVATVQGARAEPVATRPDPLSWARTWKAQRRLAVVSGAMAAVVGLTGVGVASSRSLPGQPFYGLKRAAEDVQLRFADNDTARGTKHLEFASTRLREVRALVAGEGQLAVGTPGRPLAGGRALGGSLRERVTDTLRDFGQEATQGRDLLEGVYRRTGETAPLRILRAFSAQQEARLAALIPDLPAGTANAAQESLALVEDLAATAEELLALGTCTQACDPGNGGPSLPDQPVPTPGASTSEGDNNGVPGCSCAPEPSGTPAPSPTPEPGGTPKPEPSPTPTQSPTPTPTPSPSPSSLLPTLPVPLPTILPTGLPTDLPLPFPTILPTLLPEGITRD